MNLDDVNEIRRTCYACPSQWEACLDNGKIVYIRYRHDCLSIEISTNIAKNFEDAKDWALLYDDCLGPKAPWRMDNKTMLQYLEKALKEVNNGENR